MLRLIAAAALAALACGCSRESSQEPGKMREPAAVAEVLPDEPAALDPVAQVTALYAPYLKGKTVKSVQDAAPWMYDLRELLAQAAAVKDEVILDADPIVAAQDWEISNLSVALEAPPEAGRARVVAKFANLGQEQAVHYDLLRIGDSWLVDNIRSGDWDLRKNLTEGLEAAETR
jgi:hypothetical protein